MYKKQEFPQGFQLPHKIRIGEIVTDGQKGKWKIGKSIGGGGFADIYEVSKDIHKAVGPDAKYVMKIEPSENGPLFVELHCYHRIGNEQDINQWMKDKRLPHLGMPRLLASGCHHYRGNKYRFIVLDKFGKDVQTLFEECKRKIPAQQALNLAIKTLDVLEYIHSCGYIHGDIKGSNLLLDKEQADKKVYLLDFGLAVKYVNDGDHAVYSEDLRFAHGGTIEYASRDAHIGAYSRKSDLESLGYNLVHWCSGSLPWENCLDDEDVIKERKMKYMTNIDDFMNVCFPGRNKGLARVLAKYLACVNKMKFEADPNYSRLKNILVAGLQLTGVPNNPTGKAGTKTKRPTKRKSNEENANAPPPKLKLGEARKPLSSCRNLRSTPDYVENFQFDLNELFKMERSPYKERVDAESKNVTVDDPTPIMKQVMAQLKKTANGSLRKSCPMTPEGEPLENFDSVPNAVIKEIQKKMNKKRVIKAEKASVDMHTEVTRKRKGSKSSSPYSKANEEVVLDKNSNETIHKRRSKTVMCKLECCAVAKESVIPEVSFKSNSNLQVSEYSTINKSRKSSKAAQKRLAYGKCRSISRSVTEEEQHNESDSRKKTNGRLPTGQETVTAESRPTRRRRHLSAYHSPIHSSANSRAPSPNEILVETSTEVKAFASRRRHQSTQSSPIQLNGYSGPPSPQTLVSQTSLDWSTESRPSTRRKRHASSVQSNVDSRPSSPEMLVNQYSLESSVELRPSTRRKRHASSVQPNVDSRPSSPETVVNQYSLESFVELRPSTRRKRHASLVQSNVDSRPSSPEMLVNQYSLESIVELRPSTRRKRHASSVEPNVGSRPSSPETLANPISLESGLSTRRKRCAASTRPKAYSRPASPISDSRSLSHRTRYPSEHPFPIKSVSRPQSPILSNSEYRSIHQKRHPVHLTPYQSDIDSRPSSPDTGHSSVDPDPIIVFKPSARRKRRHSVHSSSIQSGSRPSSPLEVTPMKFSRDTLDINVSPYRKQRDSKSLACHLMSTPPSSYGVVYL